VTTAATVDWRTEPLATAVGTVRVLRAGAGRPLVYLHSAGGETAAPVLDDLARSYQLIVPEFPGFGESEGIEQIDDMEDAVFHLLEVWERLALDRPAVMGLSLGGWMALELATRYPEAVSALVLVNPVGIHLDEAPVAELFGRSPSELAEMLFADQQHPIAAAMHALDAFSGDVGRQTEIPLEVVLPMWKALGATAKLGWDPYLHNPKLRRRLGRIRVPTLVVAGARDGLVPTAVAQTFAAEIPGARLEVLDDAAHWLVFEKPAELAELVRGFLGTA
jgi:pimeloyl-ACP methyl ester carboxylesterase